MDAKGTVLVVDDDLMIRRGLQRMITGRGYNVEVAASAEEAQNLLARQMFDLVITDLQMPGQDGLTLLNNIKERRAQVPVVMLTGHGSMDVVVQALRYGANDFVSKPYQPEELLSIVDREVRRYKQALPPGMQDNVSFQLSAEHVEAIDRVLLNLRVEINARSVLLIEGNGSVITAKGAVDELNISALGALVAGDFAATAGIASLIGEEAPFQLNFHEGTQYSVYSGQVISGVYLLVVFGQDIRLGAVLYYTKDALEKLNPIFEASVIKESARPARKPAPPPAVPPPTASAEPTAAPSEVPVETEAEEPAPESQELFSFEDIVSQGLLDEEMLSSLETQLGDMWSPE